MAFSSEFDRDVSFWLNVVCFDAAIVLLLGSPAVGDDTWWPWHTFLLMMFVFFIPARSCVLGIWYAMHRDDNEGDLGA